MTNAEKLMEDKLDQALARATELMGSNNLEGWRINFDTRRAVIAEVFHREKVLSYSKYFVAIADKEQFDGVTLHEITHALLGPGMGHDKEFVELCTKISPNDHYARLCVDIPLRKYILSCPECGYSGSHQSDEPKNCVQCWNNNKIVKFNVRKNELKVQPW